MLKIATLVLLIILCPRLNAAEPLRFSDFSNDPLIKDKWRSVIKKASLPLWVNDGGTTTQSTEVIIEGKKYLVISGCKPHDCSSQTISVIFSPESKRFYGLYTERGEDQTKERLTWLNIASGEQIDIRTILYAKFTGSLDNHPGQFNLK